METASEAPALAAADKPLVSVIVPTFNRVRMLGETLDTILGQSFKDFEVIIVDNMSEDGTEAYVAGLGDPRLRYFRNPNYGVISVSRNFAIARSRGKYLAFCDDDDLWLLQKLALQVAFMENRPELGLSFGYAENFGTTAFAGLLLYAKDESDSVDNFEKLLQGNKIATFTVMVRKDCLDEVGGFDTDPEFKAVEDYDLWLRVALRYRIACLPELLGKYRVHGDNTSGNKVKERFKLLKVVEKFKSQGAVNPGLLRKAEARIYWMIGNGMLSYRDAGYRSYLFRSCTASFSARGVLGLFLCCLPLGAAHTLFDLLERVKVNCRH